MKKSSIKFVLISFFIWRLVLSLVTYFAVKYLPVQLNFLGGGSANYLNNPHFWAWGNFDGQHYVNIAQNGYGFGEYTFFPLYPLILKVIGSFFGSNLFVFYLGGQLVSNISFLIGLIGFYKLARLDYSEKVTRLAIILLLLFPTSFYFAAVYTESLFFALLVWCFYFFFTKKTWAASILGILLAGLRPVGIIIFPALMFEWYFIKSKKSPVNSFPISLLIIPIGLIGYMYYLKIKLNDYFAFFSNQVYVGEHRSSKIILIPQILYRYLFKIFPSLNYNYLPGVFFTFLEFAVSIVYFVLVILLFFAARPSYALFSFLAYLTPTFLGSFSSQPRYVLVLFPVYLIVAKYLINKKALTFAFYLVSFILLLISLSLFARGYWLS